MKIDASVIQRLSQGDREAYTAVFREYYAPLVVYSSRIVKEREIAEDIVQEFFCYLWKQRRQLAEMHSFTTYLYRSIHNRLLNYLRDRRGIPIEDQDMLKEDDFVGRMMEEEVYRELYGQPRHCPSVGYHRRNRAQPIAPGKGNPPAEVDSGIGVEFVYSDMSGAFREMDRQRIEILLK